MARQHGAAVRTLAGRHVVVAVLAATAAASAGDGGAKRLMHALVRWRRQTLSSRGGRLGASRIAKAHVGLLLVPVHGGASAVGRLAQGLLGVRGRAYMVRRVAGRGPPAVNLAAICVLEVGVSLRALRACGVDARQAGAEAVAGSWRRGQRPGRHKAKRRRRAGNVVGEEGHTGNF